MAMGVTDKQLEGQDKNTALCSPRLNGLSATTTTTTHPALRVSAITTTLHPPSGAAGHPHPVLNTILAKGVIQHHPSMETTA